MSSNLTNNVEFGLEQTSSHHDVNNIFDDLENLTAENPELEMLTTLALLDEARVAGNNRSISNDVDGDECENEEDGRIKSTQAYSTNPDTNDNEVPKIEDHSVAKNIVIYDILDESFIRKLPKQIIDKFKIIAF